MPVSQVSSTVGLFDRRWVIFLGTTVKPSIASKSSTIITSTSVTNINLSASTGEWPTRRELCGEKSAVMLSPSLTSNLDLMKNAACLFVVPSFNKPRFSPNASWNPNGTTFVSSNIIGGYPSALFINTNNTIFGLNRDSQNILIWRNASSNLMNIISANLSYPVSVFVAANGEIFADGGSSTDGRRG